MARLVVLAIPAILAWTLVACELLEPPPSPSPSPLISGIRGRILVGPTCPGATLASPCLDPYAARIVVLDATGAVVTEATAGADGRLELLLAPGEYTLVPVAGGDPYPNAKPLAVSVVEGDLAEVEIRYDSGLREGRR